MNKLTRIFLVLGWVLLFVFLTSGYIFNKFSNASQSALFTPIEWSDHLTVFEGALSCSLTSAELQQRKEELRKDIFPKLKKKEELTTGYVYYFDDEEGLTEKLMEFISKEKQCCPFFKFDLSILPFEKGLALQISGSEAVKEFLDEMDF